MANTEHTGRVYWGYKALALLAIIAMGLPLLAGGRGGLGVFASPTVGFLVGFPVAAFVTGWIVETWRSAPLGIVAGMAAVLGGVVVLYAFGVAGMSVVMGKTLPEAAMLGMAFLPGDLIKVVLAALVTQAIARMRPGSLLSRTESLPAEAFR